VAGDAAGPQVDDPQPTAELVALRDYGHIFQCWAGLREADESVPAVEGQSSCNAGQRRYGGYFPGGGINHIQPALAGVEKKDLLTI
jgi:hypothetical protein